MDHRMHDTASVNEQDARELVLVVEDNRGIRDLLEIMLEDEGILVETAADGAEALAVLDHIQPTAVLLDLDLPLVSGASVADGLHARYADTVPIILITANAHPAAGARRVGALAYFAKPFNLTPVLDAVHRAVRLGSLAQYAVK